MSSELTPDNCRDVQEAAERQKEANARQFEAFQRKGGTLFAERKFAEQEKLRQARIRRNERELDRLEAEGKGDKRLRQVVMHEGALNG